MPHDSRFQPQTGIAIGPILFITAVLAILAAAIAAGSGSFTGGTTNETAKLMATTILQQASGIEDAVNLVRGQLPPGQNDTNISFEVLPGVYKDALGVDWGQIPTNSYHIASCTSDACMVYRPAGGGATPPITPQAAIDQATLDIWYGDECAAGNNLGCCFNWQQRPPHV